MLGGFGVRPPHMVACVTLEAEADKEVAKQLEARVSLPLSVASFWSRKVCRQGSLHLASLGKTLWLLANVQPSCRTSCSSLRVVVIEP